MNARSNAIPEPSPESQGGAPAAIPTMKETRPLYWSVRRELWEHRSLFIAPLAVAGVLLLGSLISPIFYRDKIANIMRPVLELDPAMQGAALAKPYSMAASMILLTSFIVAMFYCLDALHSERRDRSILFWKSLPVSDLTTVLAKVSIPLVVVPLFAFAVALATQSIMLLLGTAVFLGNGLNAATLWTQPHWFQMSLVMLYGLAVHVLWYAPIYGWLLLLSAWARRTPFLWVVLPPLALFAGEMIAFHTSYFASLLRYRLLGAMTEAFNAKPMGGAVIDRLEQLDPVRFLSSPGLWSGLLFAAAFLAAAVRLRRYREPI